MKEGELGGIRNAGRYLLGFGSPPVAPLAMQPKV